MTGTATTSNGVDVEQLMETIRAIEEDPDQASFTFRASTRWRGGTHNRGRVGRFIHAGREDTSRGEPFEADGDEPPVLLGRNLGPNAVELLLEALGFCYAVGYVANAAARGIEISGMDYEIEGDLDVRAFLGLPGPRAGFTAIRVKGIVTSPHTSSEDLQELCRYVQDTSPVRDCLANAVPVTTTLEIH